MASNAARVVLLFVLLAGPASGPAAADSRLAVVPIEVSGDRILMKGVTINGQPGQILVLDSGAGRSGVFATEARRLGLTPDREAQALGGGGRTVVGVTSGNRIAFGDVVLTGIDLAHFQVPAAVTNGGARASGIIGYDLLKDYVVSIDFDRSVIEIHDRGSYRYTGPGESLPLTLQRRTPGIRAVIVLPGGRAAEADFGLDLGAPHAMHLDSAFVARHRLLDDREHLTSRTLRGVGPAAHTAYEGRVSELRIGRTASRDVPALLDETSPEVFRIDGRSGVLGLSFLKRFDLVFDYARGRLHLEPNAAFDRPFAVPLSAQDDGVPVPGDSLFAAARNGDLERLNAGLGVDSALVNRPSASGTTLLHLAASKGHLAVASRLLELGANPNAREPRNGATPLHFAVYFGHREIVALLVRKGADVHATDRHGMTPADMAQATGKPDFVTLLNGK